MHRCSTVIEVAVRNAQGSSKGISKTSPWVARSSPCYSDGSLTMEITSWRISQGEIEKMSSLVPMMGWKPRIIYSLLLVKMQTPRLFQAISSLSFGSRSQKTVRRARPIHLWRGREGGLVLKFALRADIIVIFVLFTSLLQPNRSVLSVLPSNWYFYPDSHFWRRDEKQINRSIRHTRQWKNFSPRHYDRSNMATENAGKLSLAWTVIVETLICPFDLHRRSLLQLLHSNGSDPVVRWMLLSHVLSKSSPNSGTR